MARKKKVETLNIDEAPKSRTPIIKHAHDDAEAKVRPGTVIWIDRKDLPGNVLGRVYQVNGVNARLVYIGERCKFIVE